MISQPECEGLVGSLRWSTEEFGTAELGNALRTQRLVTIAARAAQHPHGLITSVFDNSADREGTYRFVENQAVRPAAVTEAAARGCMRRMRGEQIVVAPIDGSSLSFSDPDGSRNMGSVGARKQMGRGIKTLTTIGVTLEGEPLGILGQTLWRRPLVPNPVKHQNRPFATRETAHWVAQMERISRLADKEKVDSRIWFVGDCESDFKEALEFGVNASDNVWLTVRNAFDRRIHDVDCDKLWDAVETLPKRGAYKLRVPAGDGRAQRRANMRVRAGYVTLMLRKRSNSSRDKKQPVRIGVVWAIERGTTPAGEKPIEWLLLTTAPVDTKDDALLVIHTYSLRWRVEDFHKAWKTGCRIEDSQLGDIHNVMRWAAIMASVAIRIERIKHLSRTQPTLPASVEFSADEITAARLLAEPNSVDESTPDMATMTKWVAQLGGYVSYRSRPPPGTKVLSRGLMRVLDAAQALKALRARGQT